MSTNILNTIFAKVDGDLIKSISASLQEEVLKTQFAFRAAVPALLGGMIKKSSSMDGSEQVFRAVNGLDEALFDNFAELVSGEERDGILKRGNSIAAKTLGSHRGLFVDSIAKHTQVTPESAKKLLSLTAILLVGALQKEKAADSLNRNGIVNLLLTQKENVGGALPATLIQKFGFGEMVGGGRPRNSKNDASASAASNRPSVRGVVGDDALKMKFSIGNSPSESDATRTVPVSELKTTGNATESGGSIAAAGFNVTKHPEASQEPAAEKPSDRPAEQVVMVVEPGGAPAATDTMSDRRPAANDTMVLPVSTESSEEVVKQPAVDKQVPEAACTTKVDELDNTLKQAIVDAKKPVPGGVQQPAPKSKKKGFPWALTAVPVLLGFSVGFLGWSQLKRKPQATQLDRTEVSFLQQADEPPAPYADLRPSRSKRSFPSESSVQDSVDAAAKLIGQPIPDELRQVVVQGTVLNGVDLRDGKSQGGVETKTHPGVVVPVRNKQTIAETAVAGIESDSELKIANQLRELAAGFVSEPSREATDASTPLVAKPVTAVRSPTALPSQDLVGAKATAVLDLSNELVESDWAYEEKLAEARAHSTPMKPTSSHARHVRNSLVKQPTKSPADALAKELTYSVEELPSREVTTPIGAERPRRNTEFRNDGIGARLNRSEVAETAGKFERNRDNLKVPAGVRQSLETHVGSDTRRSLRSQPNRWPSYGDYLGLSESTSSESTSPPRNLATQPTAQYFGGRQASGTQPSESYESFDSSTPTLSWGTSGVYHSQPANHSQHVYLPSSFARPNNYPSPATTQMQTVPRRAARR